MSSPSVKVAPPRRFCSHPASRIMWKEFWQHLPLFCVFVGIMFLIAFLQYRIQPRGIDWWCSGSWLVLCFFSLTSGIYLFSPEFENNTSAFLQQLPVSSGFIVRNKILTGIFFLLAFIAIAALVQAFQVFVLQEELVYKSGFVPIADGSDDFITLGAGIILPIECFICGTLCSLAIRRAIFATIAAISLLLITWVSLAILSGTAIQLFQLDSGFASLSCVTAIKLLLVTVLTVAIYPLGKRWLGNAPQIGATNQLPMPASAGTKYREVAGTFLDSPSLPVQNTLTVDRKKIFSCLFWQTFRQQRIHFFVFLAVVATGLVISIWIEGLFSGQVRPSAYYGTSGWSTIVMGVLCLVSGQLAFAPDNFRDRYQFLQQHGNFPWMIWGIRILPSVVLVLCCVAVVGLSHVSLIQFERQYDYRDSGFNPNSTTIKALLTIVTAFAIGQYNSIFFKSIVYTIGMNLVMAASLTFWFQGVQFYSNHQLLLYYVPIPTAMIITTWLWSPHWIAGHNKNVSVLIPHAIMVALITTLVVTCLLVNGELN